MDPTDLHELPGPERKPYGFDPDARLTFVPPPELPAPEYASVNARAKALAIDTLIGLLGVVVLGAIFGGISSSNGLLYIKISGPPILMATVLWLAYMTLMESKYGASVGKRARGLRVVMEDGAPLSAEAALMRNLLRFLDAAPYVVPYFVAIKAISRSPKMQRFGDRVAETMVVHAPASPDSAEVGLPTVLPPLGADPATGPSSGRKRRRLLALVVAALLVVVGIGVAAAVFLMR
jgi:uncharacterized RDD family membrane protein YckC